MRFLLMGDTWQYLHSIITHLFSLQSNYKYADWISEMVLIWDERINLLKLHVMC